MRSPAQVGRVKPWGVYAVDFRMPVLRKPASRSGTTESYHKLQEKLKSEQEKVKAEQENVKAEREKVKAEQEKVKVEQEKVKAEQEKVKAEQEKVKTEQDKVRALLRQLDQERELRRLFMDAAALRGVSAACEDL